MSRLIKEAIELVSTTMSSMLNDAKINNYRSGDQAVEYTGHAIGGVVETGTTSTLSTTPRKTVMNHSDPTKTVVNYNYNFSNSFYHDLTELHREISKYFKNSISLSSIDASGTRTSLVETSTMNECALPDPHWPQSGSLAASRPLWTLLSGL